MIFPCLESEVSKGNTKKYVLSEKFFLRKLYVQEKGTAQDNSALFPVYTPSMGHL